MTRLSWLAFLIGGSAAALLAAPFGQTAQGVVALLGFPLAAIGLVTGVILRKPPHRSPWLTMAASASLLFVDHVIRLLAPAAGSGMITDARIADAIGIAGYTAAVIGLHRLGRLRTNDKDPTNVVDALIVAAGIGLVTCGFVVAPMLQATTLTTAAKATNTIFDALDFLLFFMLARLAIGPGVKSVSYRLLTLTPITMLLSDQLIALGQADLGFHGDIFLLLLFTPIGCAAAAAAALHPSMIRITAPADVPIASLTAARFVMMALAILSPATVLVVRPEDSTWAIPAWVCIVSLAMVRFTALVKARERVNKLDTVLTRASAALVAGTSKAQLYDAALTAMMDLVAEQRTGVRASILHVVDGAWRFEASRGWKSEFVAGQGASQAATDLVRSSTRTCLQLRNVTPIDLDDGSICHLLVVPLVSQNQTRGALVLTSETYLQSANVDAIETLASHLGLAIEAAYLSEDLHRRRSDRRFRALVENSNEVLLVLDDQSAVTFLSPAAERVLNGSGTRRSLADAIHEADRASFVALIMRAKSSPDAPVHDRTVELRMTDGAGSTRWYEATATNMSHDSEVAGLVVNAHDITTRKALEDDLRHRVLHDDLTGIANRVLLRERAEHALTRRRQGSTAPAMLFIDLDDFKTVNDGLGHTVGDELLKVIAFRIASFLREHDTVARLGGDEFAVLLDAPEDVVDVHSVANRLLEVIAEPLTFDGREIAVTASIGIAIAEEGSDAAVLIRNADVAMYEAKRNGKGRVAAFDDSMYATAVERLDLKADLGRAVERDELTLHYQPLINLQSGNVTGFEALVRWIHPKRGFVSPDSFIPLAEESGQIVQVGFWVLRTALAQLAQWRNDGVGQSLTMSVNVSPRQLEEPGIVDQVRRLLTELNLPASAVTLELTESSQLEDPNMRHNLEQLGAIGVGIAADDFGSGFASYAALQQLPFTAVKIDRSLILGLEANRSKAVAQLESIVRLAHSTGLTVVAEGIETARDSDLLREMGCDRGQGYFFGRPTTSAEATEVLRTECESRAIPTGAP